MTGATTSLVADIGATHARFCLASAGPGGGLRSEPVRLATADYADSADLLEAALAGLGEPALGSACLAIAGPVTDGRGRITNGSLTFDVRASGRRLGCPTRLVNDFHALARSLPDLQHLKQVGGAAPGHGVKAVLGPGSGLGMGLLAPVSGTWQVLPSEGGHADLAPGNPLEAELLSVLQTAHGHVSWETVLSGPGLQRLYAAVCRLWGMQPQSLTPEQITASGRDADEPVCHQTLDTFFGLLGAAAGNLALTAWAVGGVYIGGGIVPGLTDFAVNSPLRRRFEERGPMTGEVQRIPLYLITDPAPGLLGALGCLGDGAYHQA